MNKREIKARVKEIKKDAETIEERLNEELEIFEEIKGHIEAITEIQDDKGIDCGVDFETVLNDSFRSVIEESECIATLRDEINTLKTDIEEWQSEVSDSKAESIQEDYIDVFYEVVEYLDFNDAECLEDVISRIDECLMMIGYF